MEPWIDWQAAIVTPFTTQSAPLSPVTSFNNGDGDERADPNSVETIRRAHQNEIDGQSNERWCTWHLNSRERKKAVSYQWDGVWPTHEGIRGWVKRSAWAWGRWGNSFVLCRSRLNIWGSNSTQPGLKGSRTTFHLATCRRQDILARQSFLWIDALFQYNAVRPTGVGMAHYLLRGIMAWKWCYSCTKIERVILLNVQCQWWTRSTGKCG